MAEGLVILHDAAEARWLRFGAPCKIIDTHNPEEVIPSLTEIESLVQRKGWYAAGFISYDAACAFDAALQAHFKKDFPLLWFGLYEEPEEWELPYPDYEAYSMENPAPSISRSEYDHAIQCVKRYIESGDTYQVNYTLRLNASFGGDPGQLFLAMVRAQSAGYAAYVDTGRYAICSASPELFFRLENGELTCKPMKGTVRRGRTLKEDKSLADWLRESEKNRAENLMIVDMIRNDLGRVADVGSVRVPRMFEVERHHTLWQMTSTVTASCRKSLAEILSALFPCASITGAPKIRTAEIIAELEPTPRGIYTGCIGYVTPDKKAQFSVAIRTAVVDRVSWQVEYGSGGGIVWDSASKDEYKEALLKARVLTEKRPNFSLLETIRWTPEESYFLLEYHLRRLSDSAEYFDYPVDIDQIRHRLNSLVESFRKKAKRLRLLVSANGGIDFQVDPLNGDESDGPVRVKLAVDAINSSDVFLYHKTTYRQLYENARQRSPNCDDVLLWNERGEVTESCIANVVVEMQGELFTPPVDSGLLAGTYRAYLLDHGKIRERTIKTEDLSRCNGIHLINSVRKWQKAVLCENGPV